MTCLLAFCRVVAIASLVAAGPISANDLAPTLRLEFHARLDAYKEVQDFFAQFARTNGLEIANGTPKMPLKEGLPIVNIELWRGDTISVAVTNIVRPDQYFVFAYKRKPDPAFAEIVDILTEQLVARWQAKPYRGD